MTWYETHRVFTPAHEGVYKIVDDRDNETTGYFHEDTWYIEATAFPKKWMQEYNNDKVTCRKCGNPGVMERMVHYKDTDGKKYYVHKACE